MLVKFTPVASIIFLRARKNNKGKFFIRRYYFACYLDHQCLQTLLLLTVPEHFSVYRDSRMVREIGDLTSSIISSGKNLPLHTYRSCLKVNNSLYTLYTIYSEKATQFCKISTLLLSYVVPVKSKVEISQNFVAFSEYMNFTYNPFQNL